MQLLLTRWQFLRGLRAKLILLLVVPSVVIVSLLLILFRLDLRQAILQQYVEDGLMMTATVQQQFVAVQSLPMKEVAPQILALVLQQRPQYTHLSLRSISGEVIATGPMGSFHHQAIGKARIERIIASGKTTYTIVEYDSVGPGLWLEIVSPIMEGSAVVAALVAHRPLGQERFLIQAIMRDVMITAIVGISGLLLMFFIGFHLVFLRRLRRLGEASKQIAGGHYEAHVAIPGRDELAVLGATFNQMARSIESAIEERKVAEQKLQQLAITDGLTGLMNYREFQRQLDAEIERSQRYNHPLAILMIDIDHFKRVNDEHGHPAGDAVLKALADVIRGSIRTIDMAARYGGEEFVVILPETPLDGARIVAERLRRRVAEHPLTGPAGQRLTCSVSVGVAMLPEDAVRKEPLIDAADQALYGAKSAGRNTVKSYQDVRRINSAEPAGKTPIPSAE